MQTKIQNQCLKKLIMLDKVYKDVDKFASIDDKFNFKVTNFFDKYRRVGLLKDGFI